MINKKIILAGLLASVVMGVIEMMYEGLFGQGFWSPIVYIAATILRNYQSVTSPVPFNLLPVILGLMGHMMNSVILGIVFVLTIAKRQQTLSKNMLFGVIYGLMVFFVMWLVVVPFIDPVILRLNPYVFAFSHIMWGLTLGYMLIAKR